jgi:RNA 2',3'-cyclic 3'-phosphodiesterase
MNLIRTFIAAELPADLLLALNKLQRSLRDAPGGSAVNWVRPEGIHLTLKFLGDVSVETLPRIYVGVEQVCARLNSFTVRVNGLGCFPNLVRPRVVWVGLEDEYQQLQRMQQALENELATGGFTREVRVFQPHLTLGRVRNSALSPEVEILGRTIAGYEHILLGQIQVNHLCVISSTLRPAGAVYQILHQSPLIEQVPSGDAISDALNSPTSA